MSVLVKFSVDGTSWLVDWEGQIEVITDWHWRIRELYGLEGMPKEDVVTSEIVPVKLLISVCVVCAVCVILFESECGRHATPVDRDI